MPDSPNWRTCVRNNMVVCIGENHCAGRGCERSMCDDGELLSVAEIDAIEKLGALYRVLIEIIGPNSSSDKTEMVAHIHNLQRMVMAQAAARAYPDQYRLLGNRHA